ncbi:hypothetical protein BH11BAC2_BH11BAC2_07150 [soil metagenome]
MQSTQALSGQGLINLHQLPKDKPVLDFVLSRLGNNSSPERFEIISNLLAMYRTSAGFDPMALSKGRMRRVKSAEFRKLLTEIDHELALILNSEEYRQLVAKQASFEPLFQTYTTLSESLAVYPPASMVHEVEQFEETLKRHEASELLLSFYRQHTNFFEEINQGEALQEFIKKFDHLTERNQQLNRQTRAEFLLASLEHYAFKGKLNYPHLEELMEELGILLTAEANRYTQFELLLKIIRAGRLSTTPARKLNSYLRFIAENINEITRLNAKWSPLILSSLALYFQEANEEVRQQWLTTADHESKENCREEERAAYRLIRTSIACESGNWMQALKHLNEAEHLIHKVPGKSVPARNTWITLCEWRTLLLALVQITKIDEVDTEQYRIHLTLAEDLSKHREDNSLISIQLKMINAFVNRDWETSLELAERIVNYRKDHPDHPWKMMALVFVEIMKSSGKKDNSLAMTEALSSLNEPFYSTTGPALLRGARQFFMENSRKKVSTN